MEDKYDSKIELEIIPINKEEKNNFINIPEGYETYYHIFFNEDKNELKKIILQKKKMLKK